VFPFLVLLVNISLKLVKKCRVMHVTPLGSHGKQVVLMNSRPASRAEETAQLSTVSGYLFLVRMWFFLTGVLPEMSGSACTLLSLSPVPV